jgi:predicted ArsR family transcriptional regulator
VDDGLLDVEYSRPPGRSGPGAGRPAKRYRRARRDIAVSLPERRYDLAAHVMAEAISVARDTGIPVADALSGAARMTGRALAEQARHTIEPGPDETAPLDALGEILSRNGYEPRVTTGQVTMANCPFHRLARTHTTLTCGMNLDLVNGLLDALAATHLRALLDPSPGRCCVIVSTTPA